MTTLTRPLLPRPTDPVQQPIINSPFHPPEYHWDLDTSAKALDQVLDGRRESQNIPPVAGSRKTRGRIGLPGQFGAVWTPLKLVNDIREAVLEWQEDGYPGVTQTSRALIDHWTNPEACQLYFAQIDALLAHIYLEEAARADIMDEIRRINDRYNAGIHRIAHKMATATGKTPVMAMLILWQAANHRSAVSNEDRFVRRFLILTPGLTVKERLQDSLDPSKEGNDWAYFGLVPPGDQWERALTLASVNIINYHQMEPKQVGEPISAKGQQLIDGGSRPTTQDELTARTETAWNVIERITDGRSQQGRILVINDEGHHCHRGDPDRKDAEQDTRWFAGISQIRDEGVLHYVTDMSATPIFLAQSNPRPFDWIVSDYSLVDAIEAGLTKIPRVPTSTDRSDDSRFRDIFSHTDRRQTSDFRPEINGNNALLKEALTALYNDYEATLNSWRELNRTEQPVMAIVMNSVKNANAIYRHIASGAVTPLFSNYTDQLKGDLRWNPHTIIVHSKMEEGGIAGGETGRHIRNLAEVYRRNIRYGFTDSDKPEEIIRRVMNSVGRDGEPGENVRCVISVNMLTEGWNTKTVTHLLGFRKFGSSLLCEQVAGRTLRRITRTKEDDGIRFKPEYAQILGIPFPKYEEPTKDEKDSREEFDQVTVAPEAGRKHLRVEWPNILQLQRTGTQKPVEVRAKDEGPDEPYEAPAHISETTNVEPTAGETVRFQSEPPITANSFLYRASAAVVKQIELETAEQVQKSLSDAPIIQVGKLFSQTVSAAQDYYRTGHLTGPPNVRLWPSDEYAVQRASEWLHRNVQVIRPDNIGIQMEVVPSAIAPWQHTDLLREYDIDLNPRRVYGPTTKSEIGYADCDSKWEVDLARHLDEMPEISRWARNKGLNWSIPYVADRQQRRYWPDFIAVAPIDPQMELHIVIETKGQVREYDPIKRRWAQEYWVPAINRHPEYGTATGRIWSYLYLDSEALVLQAKQSILKVLEITREG